MSFLSLFKQKYRDRILQERDRLRTSDNPSGQLRAYNAAVSHVLEEVRNSDAGEYAELQRTLSEIREQVKLSFKDRTEDVQAA